MPHKFSKGCISLRSPPEASSSFSTAYTELFYEHIIENSVTLLFMDAIQLRRRSHAFRKNTVLWLPMETGVTELST